LSDEDLGKAPANPKFEQNNTIGFLLIHLLAHLSYHLGQINYLRRMLDAV
jgi:uncharacterized damage-inducible protein DinB